MARYRKELAELPGPGWGAAEMDRAVERGITDGTRPMDWATRQEVASMILRAEGKMC